MTRPTNCLTLQLFTSSARIVKLRGTGVALFALIMESSMVCVITACECLRQSRVTCDLENFKFICITTDKLLLVGDVIDRVTKLQAVVKLCVLIVMALVILLLIALNLCIAVFARVDNIWHFLALSPGIVS